MDIDKILSDLNSHIQMLEDLKTSVIEMQEETRGLITGVKLWFDQHGNKLPEVK